MSFSLSDAVVMNLKKSWGDESVAVNIFEIVSVDGQRGCSYLENLLLLLNVVGSSPLHFARPEQDNPCSCANKSMADLIMIHKISPWFHFVPDSFRHIIITRE